MERAGRRAYSRCRSRKSRTPQKSCRQAELYLLYSVFAQSILRVAAECAEQTFQLIRRLGEPYAVDAAQHEGHTEIAPPKIGIGANFEIRVAGLQRSQVVRNGPLAEMAADAPAPHLLAAPKAMFELLEDPLHDAWHPGKHENIANLKPWGPRNGIGEQRCPFRDHRHAHPRRVQITRRVVSFEKPLRLWMKVQRHTKSIGNGLCGDVVVGRANSARGKDIVEDPPHRVDRGYYCRRVIRDHPCLPHPDPDLVKPSGEKSEVGVLRAPGKNLIPDDQDTGGDNRRLGVASGHLLLGLFLFATCARHKTQRYGAKQPGLPAGGRMPTLMWRQRRRNPVSETANAKHIRHAATRDVGPRPVRCARRPDQDPWARGL